MRTIQIKPRAHLTNGKIVPLDYEAQRSEGPAGCAIYDLRIQSTQKRAIRISRIELFTLNLGADRVQVFRQGFFMPGDPAGFHVLVAGQRTAPQLRGKGACRGDYDFVSDGIAVIRLPGSRKMELLGFTTGRCFHCFWLFRTRGKAVRLWAQCNLDGIILEPGRVLQAEQIVLMEGDDFASLTEGYAELAARANCARVPGKTVTGWSDWQYYRRNKTEQDVLRSAAAVKRLNDDGFGLDLAIVDAGYCDYSSEWLGHCRKFPSGMRALGRKLRRRYGLRMGVWFAPHVTNVKTAVARRHPDWLVKSKATGRPLGGPASCVGEYYVLDYSVPGALNWLRRMVRTMVRDWGVEYIKLDGPNPDKYAGGRLRDGRMTVVQMFRKTLEAIRGECGPDVLIEGEGIYGPSMGIVDIQRVQQDAWTFWSRPDRPRAGMKENLKNELLSSFLHGRVWHNNRECVILRDFPSPHHRVQENLPGTTEAIIPVNEMRFQLSAAALAGGAMLLTDPMDQLLRDGGKKVLISQFLPHFETRGCRPIDVFGHRGAPSLYYLPIRRDFEQWIILGVFNWEESYQDFRVPLDRFAGSGRWRAFEFWQQAYMGTHSKTMAVKDVPAHGCRMIALREARKGPQLIGTDMHIFQGAVDLASASCSDGSLDIVVKHILQDERSLTIWRPGRLRLRDIQTNARHVLVDDRKRNLLTVHFSGRRRTRFRLQFAPKQ